MPVALPHQIHDARFWHIHIGYIPSGKYTVKCIHVHFRNQQPPLIQISTLLHLLLPRFCTFFPTCNFFSRISSLRFSSFLINLLFIFLFLLLITGSWALKTNPENIRNGCRHRMKKHFFPFPFTPFTILLRLLQKKKNPNRKPPLY